MSAGSGSPITTYFRVCEGVRVRFADTNADSDTTVLLLAPWPESVWAFRRIWHQLTALGRIVAIEMPGFGHSDQSRPELIAPDASGDFLARLIDEWGLGSPHVVGPDVGTAAALFLAARTPERVTSLTVGGGAVRFPIDAGGALKDIIEAPNLDVVRALDARTNIGYAVEAGAASETEPEVTRITSAPTTSAASPSRLALSGTTRTSTLPCVSCCRQSPRRPRSSQVATMISFHGRTTNTSTSLCPTARFTPSMPVTSLGNGQRRNTAAWLSSGSTAGTCVQELRRRQLAVRRS
jgi:pimeloyl-ACP methyl ester carboxylesterase